MSFIKPLTLGSLQLECNIIQGPLAGYSCAPMRLLANHWGRPGYCVTEMLSAYNLAHCIDRSPRYNTVWPDEGLVCFQLSGSDPDILSSAVNRAECLGASLIDLNCGCPQPKIRTKTQGSRLLQYPDILFNCLTAMRKSTQLPLTCKIRIDGRSSDNFTRDVVAVINESAADAMIVHGRHWKEKYDTPAYWDEIALIKQLSKIPVIGNGDVDSAVSCEKFFSVSGCDGIMISRASLGQPWIFEQIKSFAKKQNYHIPDLFKQGNMLLQHVRGLIEFDGEHAALLQSRKLCKYYARYLPHSDIFIEKAKHLSCYSQLTHLVENHFFT